VCRGAFDERLDLRLVRVEAGSAVPVLERRGDTGELPLPDEFDRARDLVIESIDAVVRDGALRDLPDEQLGTLFARLGQTLEGDESIEIGRPGAQPRVCYDRAARRRALLARTDTYVEPGSLTGTAVSLDRERPSLPVPGVRQRRCTWKLRLRGVSTGSKRCLRSRHRRSFTSPV
jgi:hypothetical protein